MCSLSLSSPYAFRRTGKHEEHASDVAIDHIWTRSQVTAPVSRTSQCVRAMPLIWKYIKCMRVLSMILFVCYYVISTIFGLKLIAR